MKDGTHVARALSDLYSRRLIAYAMLTHVRHFLFLAEDGIRDDLVTGVQTCALPICSSSMSPNAVRRVRWTSHRTAASGAWAPARTAAATSAASNRATGTRDRKSVV